MIGSPPAWMPELRLWECVKCSAHIESMGSLDATGGKDGDAPTYRHAGCGGLLRLAPKEDRNG
jgi:hypothetical protein